MNPLGRRLPAATVVVLAAGLTGAVLAPPDRVQGEYQRLMYLHVPTAWTAYLCFVITFAASGLWLWRRKDRFDRLAAASAEVGVLFTGLTIALGSWWGKPVWGVWWTWDPRLITTALMFFVYLGYLALRRATLDHAARARRAAVLGVVAFVQVPIVHLSVVWWRALHQPPTVLKPGDPSIDHRMLLVLLVNVLGFTLLAITLLRARTRLSSLEEDLTIAQATADSRLAGLAVAAPRLEGPANDA
ncbi:cytochrome c biogenesis protein CcsA [Amycolatopsis sp. NPDC057786]|uniref:cytochrome c biogenesis protein CcsA n=1 Tax=Amycolatopsis sp. NPDC057786 TaxID=3346250 RepID=UPI0036703BAF